MRDRQDPRPRAFGLFKQGWSRLRIHIESQWSSISLPILPKLTDRAHENEQWDTKNKHGRVRGYRVVKPGWPTCNEMHQERERDRGKRDKSVCLGKDSEHR
jgi:hypothetical protein